MLYTEMVALLRENLPAYRALTTSRPGFAVLALEVTDETIPLNLFPDGKRPEGHVPRELMFRAVGTELEKTLAEHDFDIPSSGEVLVLAQGDGCYVGESEFCE